MRTAIYVLKRNNEIVYLGKSTNPYERWKYHRRSRKDGKDLIMEIVDEFNDLELEWILKLQNQGILLENKTVYVNSNPNWNIGDSYSKLKTK